MRRVGRSPTTVAPGLNGSGRTDGRIRRVHREMSTVGLILTFSAIIPLLAAANANRSTSLVHATAWAIIACSGWMSAFATGSLNMLYLALALTCCAGVAVLGARRPGAAAWNFVVVGLLVILALPMGQAAVLGTAVHPGTMLNAFLVSLIGLTVINYLPTRLGVGAVALAAGCGFAIHDVLMESSISPAASCFVGIAPWLAWGSVFVAGAKGLDDRSWLAFRDRFGLVWGLRVREQFNPAAENSGLASRLRWSGIRPPDPAADDLFEALTKRFLV
jgi:hypothetical protein